MNKEPFTYFLKAFRIPHWSKNALLFVPLIAAHKVTEPTLVLHGCYAFAAFSLAASSLYVVNDILDRQEDRHHPFKRDRPFASGRLTPKQGVVAALVLLAGSLAVALLLLPPLFVGMLGIYVGTASLYSLYLKHIVVVDLLVLTGFYVLRLYAGGVSTETPVSPWLLAFSLFFFLSLAVMKRHAELLAVLDHGEGPPSNRGYHAEDLGLFRSIGPASGYLSTLILALYLNSEKVVELYARPAFLWAMLPLLLYWLTRFWLRTNRGQLVEDPIIFALKDPVSYVTGLALGAIVLAAAL